MLSQAGQDSAPVDAPVHRSPGHPVTSPQVTLAMPVVIPEARSEARKAATSAISRALGAPAQQCHAGDHGVQLLDRRRIRVHRGQLLSLHALDIAPAYEVEGHLDRPNCTCDLVEVINDRWLIGGVELDRFRLAPCAAQLCGKRNGEADVDPRVTSPAHLLFAAFLPARSVVMPCMTLVWPTTHR
jgi:hypothetical protein